MTSNVNSVTGQVFAWLCHWIQVLHIQKMVKFGFAKFDLWSHNNTTISSMIPPFIVSCSIYIFQVRTLVQILIHRTTHFLPLPFLGHTVVICQHKNVCHKKSLYWTTHTYIYKSSNFKACTTHVISRYAFWKHFVFQYLIQNLQTDKL